MTGAPNLRDDGEPAGCGLHQPPPSATHDLGGLWSCAWSRSVPEGEYATVDEARAAKLSFRETRVPGNLELDLQRTGESDDPFFGMNITHLRELEAAHAWYARRFPARVPPGQTAELVFEGIDCYASVHLNGTLLGRVDNMLVEHVFDVTGELREDNELLVHIGPACEAARHFAYPPLLRAFRTNYEALHVRKAPHMYGWDIMPRAVSAGIWRPVSLRLRPRERIEWLYLQTRGLAEDGTHTDLEMTYLVKTDRDPAGSYEIRLEADCGESHFDTTARLFFSAGSHHFHVAGPKLWWPSGYGAPDVYRVHATLRSDGTILDSRTFSLGIRTVRLERTSLTDEQGRGEFCFHVNGVRVFAKGSNWVPLDVFHSRDLERTDAAINLAVEAHCNILRCWGGNVYESDRFFDLCDAHGLMVWQDFAMACAIYPQDEEFQRRLAEEAVKVVRRLRQHPSLVLWAGDNECDQAWHSWHGAGDPNRNVLTRMVLPGVLRQEDPARPYLPSSPYIDETAARVDEKYLPENHLWGPRGDYKDAYYRDALCHFASEVGYHGCPSPESVRKFISPERVWPYQDNPEWNLHSTSPVPDAVSHADNCARVELMANQVRHLFGKVPDTLEEFAFASQATQGEAMKTFVETYRAGKWRRTGIIWWNLLDGWPQFSDAVVDYYFKKKLAYHYLCRSQQHVCVVCREPAGGRQAVVACNDTLGECRLRYRVTDIENGRELAAGQATAAANAVTELAEIGCDPDARSLYLIEWRGETGEGRNHYLAGRAPFDLQTYREWLRRVGHASLKSGI